MAFADLTVSQFEALREVHFQVADLVASWLGLAAKNTIRMDYEAAGYGWFAGATSRQDDIAAARRFVLLRRELQGMRELPPLPPTQHANQTFTDFLAHALALKSGKGSVAAGATRGGGRRRSHTKRAQGATKCCEAAP